MAVGGSFKLEGKNNLVTLNQNTFIKHSTGQKYQQIDIKNGKRAYMNTQAKSDQAEFKISTSLGSTIFSNILSLDGNADDLSAQDFDLISEAKLKQLCNDKSIKIKGKDNVSKRIVIEYSYNGADKATLIIDLETKDEQITREKAEKAKAAEDKKRKEAEKQAEAERKAKEAKELHENCKSDLEKAWDWFIGLF